VTAAADNEDWRKPKRQTASEDRSADVVDNAATVPLPQGTSDQPVTVPADDVAADAAAHIDAAAKVPLPE
jgi:hypothetical protein